MLWLILSLPILIWIWWGVVFTILNYIVQCAREKGIDMQQVLERIKEEAAQPTRARIIRYTDLTNLEATFPELLSYLDERINVLYVDRTQAERLPDFIRNRLEMTDIAFTKVSAAGAVIKFVEYQN